MPLADEIDRLIAQERLPTDFAPTIERYYRPVANAILAQYKAGSETLVVGLCGPQGSGKSTMAAFLKLLIEAQGPRAAILSIDDLYLTRREREWLAREVDPLLATRGPPGTHNVALGLEVLDALSHAGPKTVTPIPRFDKSTDDRAPESAWDKFTGRAGVILFEGWCVGARVQSADALIAPINELERTKDVQGVWRRYVNDRLARDYQILFERIGFLIMLKPPGFDCVFHWRALQEDKLRTAAGAGRRVMSRVEVAEFIMYYERITRHILAEMPTRADMVLDIGPDHRFSDLTRRAGPSRDSG